MKLLPLSLLTRRAAAAEDGEMMFSLLFLLLFPSPSDPFRRLLLVLLLFFLASINGTIPNRDFNAGWMHPSSNSLQQTHSEAAAAPASSSLLAADAVGDGECNSSIKEQREEKEEKEDWDNEGRRWPMSCHIDDVRMEHIRIYFYVFGERYNCSTTIQAYCKKTTKTVTYCQPTALPIILSSLKLI